MSKMCHRSQIWRHSHVGQAQVSGTEKGNCRQRATPSKSKVKIEQKSRSDSSDSEEEAVERLLVGEVTTQSKMDKKKALFLLLKATPEIGPDELY